MGNELEDALKEVERLKGKAEFDMPGEMQGHFHNACTDPCDVIDGPCACGAWHSAKEWIGKLVKIIKSLTAQLEAERWILKTQPPTEFHEEPSGQGGVWQISEEVWVLYPDTKEIGKARYTELFSWQDAKRGFTHWRPINLPKN